MQLEVPPTSPKFFSFFFFKLKTHARMHKLLLSTDSPPMPGENPATREPGPSAPQVPPSCHRGGQGCAALGAAQRPGHFLP